MSRFDELHKLAKNLPKDPGVYIFYDKLIDQNSSEKNKSIVYVGKAKNLKKRVLSYFQNKKDSAIKTQVLMNKAKDLEFIVTKNEKEALLLENNFIKKFQPKYNIWLKDDKTYSSIRIDMKNIFPKLGIVRKRASDNAKYLGPYISAKEARIALKKVQVLFRLRNCSDKSFKSRNRPCLNYDISICSGPCCQKISAQDYGDNVQEAIWFLKGYSSSLLARLENEMESKAALFEFEEAAQIRDRINTIKRSFDSQDIVLNRRYNADVCGLYIKENIYTINLTLIREGNITQVKKFSFKDVFSDYDETLLAFLTQFYALYDDLPSEILLQKKIKNISFLNDATKEEINKKVKIFAPQKGEKKRLIAQASLNAKKHFETNKLEQEKLVSEIDILKRLLKLGNICERIECFDISNIGGEQAVGSKVSFNNGAFDKNEYRRYKIKTVSGSDDYAMMYEVLYRRFSKLELKIKPNLVIIDGGRSHLNVATNIFDQCNIKDVSLVAIAKERVKKGDVLYKERLFVPGRKNPIIPDKFNKGMHLLMKIRDEAHRFAISYHRKIRSKKLLNRSLKD
ncbi:MAG: excinuclease ABC subunit UvrC [Pseudomonadota bacterium]